MRKFELNHPYFQVNLEKEKENDKLKQDNKIKS